MACDRIQKADLSVEQEGYDRIIEETESACDSVSTGLDESRIVKHIMVIGFHHKHGYQVDYCYPPLETGGPIFSTTSKPIILPLCWKTLPLLCLPDGSHNYDSDTIYFTMPDNRVIERFSDDKSNTEKTKCEGIRTIFGTACYRQIQADKLLNRTDDMTRVAVQKSVCVLSTKPLFGLIRSKLEMITHAYFEELDFSKVNILKLTYNNLNSLLSRDSVKDNAIFLGLSTRHLVSQFGYNLLVLFKAILLEKKILFYKSPVRELCSTIMSMCSLFTGLLESGGLDYSTCDLQLSPAHLEALKLLTPELIDDSNCVNKKREDKVFFSPSKEEVIIVREDDEGSSEHKRIESEPDCSITTGEFEMISDQETLADGSIVEDPYATKLCRLKAQDCGLPLQIFTRGSFCLPYLSISYLDLLSDTRVKSFVIGATNFLFKQRKEMYDVIVDMEENTITINDPMLKRCCSLGTEDLRFMDHLSRQVRLEADITEWVGGDEWIRYHFRIYTLYLLKSAKTQTNMDLFNRSFVQAWRQTTNNYRIWDSTGKSAILDGLQSRHPFSSSSKGINFSDMKLKLSYAVNSSERGRSINQTLNGIGRWSIWNNIASVASTSTSTVVKQTTKMDTPEVSDTDNSPTSVNQKPTTEDL